jgi:hypothetical protein
MESIKRCSPARFGGQPLNTEQQGDWTVVLEYEAEGKEPWVIDLSHRARWDLQDADISKQQPWGINIPETPGQCVLENGVLINRMNRTQASIWHLFGEDLTVPDDQAFTDVTDATVFLALLGKEIFAIAEKLTSLDFLDPLKKPPFLLQGPFLHVPCQIVILGNIPERSAILFTCSRGYAQDMIAAILEAGAEFELHPAGENAFRNWVNQISD